MSRLSLPDSMLDIRPEVSAALASGTAVVALESTLIAHGLPWPINVETALASEQAVRDQGAVPATIAALEGRPTIGLTPQEIQDLAQARDVRKASRRDLAAAIVQLATAATTVAATMCLAHLAGIRVFATGGLGGVHPPETPGEPSWDISADLRELAETPLLVVCAGAKSILDLQATLEVLETLGVPVLGYRTSTFPAFHVASSGLPVSARVESAEEAAAMGRAHWKLGGGGMVVAQPVSPEEAMEPAAYKAALDQARREVEAAGVRGPALTPALLARLAEITEGRTLEVNRKLIVANAALAGQIARVLAEESCLHPGR